MDDVGETVRKVILSILTDLNCSFRMRPIDHQWYRGLELVLIMPSSLDVQTEIEIGTNKSVVHFNHYHRYSSNRVNLTGNYSIDLVDPDSIGKIETYLKEAINDSEVIFEFPSHSNLDFEIV